MNIIIVKKVKAADNREGLFQNVNYFDVLRTFTSYNNGLLF